MELAMSLLLLLSGVGAFLTGMSKMSEGLRQGASGGLKRLFNRISGNRVVGYGVGIGATAIIQSSSATTVMTIGLANARIVDTRQGASIILGAKVGTTVTAFIFAMSGLSKGSFSMGILFASLSFVGIVLMMVARKDSHRNLATFLLGLGLLFLGLQVMSMSIGDSSTDLGQAISALFAYDIFTNAVLLIVIGAVFTCIIQSSSAASAIFITFLSTGMLGSVDQAFFLILGANIGTCIDGIIASIGANTDGKRLAIFHLLTSVAGALVFGALTVIFRQPIVNFFDTVIVSRQWSLAIFNMTYNLLYTLMLLPLLPLIVDLICRFVVDKPEKTRSVLEYLNPQILNTPAIASAHMRREIVSMGKRAATNLDISFAALLESDTTQRERVFEEENILNSLNREISNYLIKLSSLSNSIADETAIGSYHHVINDIERIGDHAKNFMVLTVELANLGEGFTDESKDELRQMYTKVNEALTICLRIFERRDRRLLKDISSLEREIDAMHKNYSKEHFRRLHDQSSWAEIQMYYDVISELERIGDHIVNIAFSIVNPIGQESYDNSEPKSTKTRTKRQNA